MSHVIRVPGYQARAFRAVRGQYVTVVDVEGKQIGDLVFLAAQDARERLSTSCTRLRAGRLTVAVGDALYSSAGRIMATIVEDTCGAHDVVSHPCDRARYEVDFGLREHANCTDNLVGALADFGMESWWLPDPFNVFMNTVFLADGRYVTEVPLSKAGDRVVMRAEIDLVGAISACPQDVYPANGYRITDLEVVISDAPSATASPEPEWSSRSTR